jgi:hypothetical protein
MLVTRRARQLRHSAEVGGARPSAPRALVAALVVSLGLGSAPALAQGPGPERPPVKAPAKLGPEPAPVATRTPAPATEPLTVTPTASRPTAPVFRSTPARSPSKISSSTNAQAGAKKTSKPRPAPAKPRVTKAPKKRPPAIERVTRTALRATHVQPGSSGSDRLLFIGGLALLVLVLGDAAFLTLSARVLRDPAQR